MKEFVFPERVVWEKETYRDNYGKIVIEPLERGYGVTVGNALRRILLSSIEGVAITALKMDGVSHEFSTVKGIKEDVIEIVMNLKQVVLKPNIKEFPHLTPEVKISGKEEICAGDLISDESAEVLNKDLHIATLSSDKAVKFQIEITRGRGYMPQEKMKFIKSRPPIGTILIDGIFSPVRKVSFNVENTRVGQFVDYEKLILEVWTTGAISPKDAVKEVTGLLNRHFSIIGENQRVGEEVKDKKGEGKEDRKTSVNMKMSISELKLTTRVLNGLVSKNIGTLEELLAVPREELEGIRNLGKKSIEEVDKALMKMGLSLKKSEKL